MFSLRSLAIMSILAPLACGCASKVPLGGNKANSNDPNETQVGNSAPSAVAIPSIEVAEPNQTQPVVAAMTAVPGNAPNQLELWVKVRIADGYYLHAYDEQHPDFIPLTVELDLPKGVAAASEWQFPKPTIEHDFPVYRNEVLVRRSLSVDDPQAPITLTAKVAQQACTAQSCQAPGTIELTHVVTR